MLTRILTAAVGVVVFFVALFAPLPFFLAAILLVTVAMLYEMYGVLKCTASVNAVGYLSGLMLLLGMTVNGGKYFEAALPFAVMLYLVAAVFVHMRNGAKEVISHGFITAYLSVFMSYIIRTSSEYGVLAVLWVFVIAWISDSGAYFVGVTLGKHKLAPNISPKKSVEGAVGGVLSAVIACGVYYIIVVKIGSAYNTLALISFMTMGLFGSVLSQLGDLAASAVKRASGVKDYGSVLPGHGGFMDRFDSVVYIAPFVYYAFTAINHFLPL